MIYLITMEPEFLRDVSLAKKKAEQITELLQISAWLIHKREAQRFFSNEIKLRELRTSDRYRRLNSIPTTRAFRSRTK